MSLVGRPVSRLVGRLVRGLVAAATGRDPNKVYNAPELDTLLQANGVAANDVVSTTDVIWAALGYANADAFWDKMYTEGIEKQDIIDAIPSGPGDPYGDEIANDSPVVRWRLNETSGTTFADSIGSNDLTIFNAPTLGLATLAGGDGSSVEFDSASSQYAKTTTVPILSFPYTINFLLKATAAPSGTLFSISDSSVDTRYLSSSLNSSGYLSVTLRDGNSKNATGSVALNDSNPHLISIVLESNGVLRTYVDGSVYASQLTPAALPVFTGLTIAKLDRPSAAYGSGIIEDVSMFPTNLSQTRLAAHWAATGN